MTPLPTRNGVGPSSVVLPPGAWPTIGRVLIERFPGISPEAGTARLQAGEVLTIRHFNEMVLVEHVAQAELDGSCDPEQGAGGHCREAHSAGFIRAKPELTRRR